MDAQIEIQNQHRIQQNKLAYYLIALCVTSIGFSVYSTSGKAISISQVPLGIAVLSWGLSILFGIKYLKILLHALYTNNALFDLVKGVEPIAGQHPEKIKIGVKVVKQAMNDSVDLSVKYSNWQDRLFYIGMISFITWHVLEMIILKINPSS